MKYRKYQGEYSTKIIIVTKRGKIIKFDNEELPSQKRGGIGVKPMVLQLGDEIVGITTVEE